jgi:hypothetical protein
VRMPWSATRNHAGPSQSAPTPAVPGRTWSSTAWAARSAGPRSKSRHAAARSLPTARGGRFASIDPQDAGRRDITVRGIEHVQFAPAHARRLTERAMSEATPGRIRPSFGTDAGAARRANQAVAGFVAELQAGWDQHDAGITNRHFADDIVWGSPGDAVNSGADPDRPAAVDVPPGLAPRRLADRGVRLRRPPPG